MFFHLPVVIVLVFLFAAIAPAREKAERPDMEMLEFLGTYQTAEGKEIDPMFLQEAKGPATDREKPRQQEKSKKPKKKEKEKERKDD